MSLDGKSHAPRLPRLAEGQDRTIYYFQLFPNLLISPHPDYIMTHRLRPLAPDRTAVECEWLFSREAVESEGFDPSYASVFWDLTNGQDWRACESVQRGASPRGSRRGPPAPRAVAGPSPPAGPGAPASPSGAAPPPAGTAAGPSRPARTPSTSSSPW